MMRQTRRFKIQFEHDSRRYEAKVLARFHIDENFGADIDNLRGTPATVIEDINVEALMDDQCSLIIPEETLTSRIWDVATDNLHKFI